jgi:hypothetical protein
MCKPKFRHDCQTCRFLGHEIGCDMYFCKQHGMPTVVVRFSDEGPDYTSGLELAKFDARLAKAKSMAIAAGLVRS